MYDSWLHSVIKSIKQEMEDSLEITLQTSL